MKVVFTNDPGNIGLVHSIEMKYLPADAEVLNADYLPVGDNAEFYRVLGEADILINRFCHIGKKEIDALKHCKSISCQNTGYNEIDIDYAAEKGIPVSSILDYCTQETAENAIATMMCLQRDTHRYNKLIHEQHKWDMFAYPHHQRVEGQTIGIVGFGRIGRHVARIANGLGMKVLAYDPYVQQSAADELGAELVDLDTIFSLSDVISVHMSLTAENAGMFNKEAFAKMKKKPIFINEGRGPMVIEKDLAWALDNGYVRAAGLDMLESEYPDTEYLERSPLVGRDDVVLTPHSGFLSDTSIELVHKISTENALYAYYGQFDKVWVIRNGIGAPAQK